MEKGLHQARVEGGHVHLGIAQILTRGHRQRVRGHRRHADQSLRYRGRAASRTTKNGKEHQATHG